MARSAGDRGGARAPRLRKALGQHHLRDGAVCAPLLRFLELGPEARVVEVGSGGGALTRELVATGARVVAIEVDLGWAAELARNGRKQDVAENRKPGPDPRSERRAPELAVADALELAWERLPAGWTVAGNLPYNVGTVILERLLRGAPAGTRAAFLLQREVVDRIVAAPGSAAYGPLSVLVAARAHARRLGAVRPGAFVPPPRVESAFVGLELLPRTRGEARLAALDRVVHAAFGQRRKTLLNALGARYGRDAARGALAAGGIDAARRAETLSLAELERLVDSLEPAAGAGKLHNSRC